MKPADYKVINAWEVEPFGGGDYQSRLLLDNKMAGAPAVNVNHGTFAPGGHTGSVGPDGKLFGPAHEKAEIYLGISGEADVYLDKGENQRVELMKQGTLVYIPGGCEHFVINRSKTEPFVLVTIWPDENDNEAHEARIKAWGEDNYIRIHKA